MKVRLFAYILMVIIFSACSEESVPSEKAESSLEKVAELRAELLALETESENLRQELIVLSDEKLVLEENYNRVISANEELKLKIEEKRNSLKEMTELIDIKREEYEDKEHFTRVGLCNIEDTFRSIMFNLEIGNEEYVNSLIADNIEWLDGNLHTIHMNDSFVLPSSSFYFTIDYYSIDYNLGEAGIIYEFFDENNERIYFCLASFIKVDHRWLLNSIETTLDPG